MKPPRRSPHGKDECLRYSVAAIFERPVSQVPHFIREEGYWPYVLRRWVHTEYGMGLDMRSYIGPRGFSWPESRDDVPDDYYIAIIAPNKRGYAHAIVMHGLEVAYDCAIGNARRQRYQKKGMGVIEFVP